MKAYEFDKKFDEGKDISEHLDISKVRRQGHWTGTYCCINSFIYTGFKIKSWRNTFIGMVGTIGIAIENLNPEGLIKTHGEIWKGLSLDNKTIKKGSAVKIISVEGLLLHVVQIENTDQE